MSNRTALTCFALLLALPGVARAEIGSLDPVPAATLLLPYFEVDLLHPTGVTTLMSVANTRQEPALVKAVLWTDLGVPTIAWHMYLTGYDVVTVNLRDIFIAGTFPATSHSNTATSPVGSFSLPTNSTTGVGPGSTSCGPALPPPALSAAMISHAQASHTGQPSAVLGGLCASVDHGDAVARGYVTIDNVNFCTLSIPGNEGYFGSGGSGVANNQNVLVGEYALIDAAGGVANGEPMIHLEASSSLGPGDYTFYRRFTFGQDQREPLGTSFWARYVDSGATANNSRLTYWRDPKRPVTPFSCALTAPVPYPLTQTQIVAFDELENPTVTSGLVPMPWAAGRVEAGGVAFPLPYVAGWLYLNLNAAVIGSTVPFEPVMQNYVAAQFTAPGQLSYGYEAYQLDNALAATGATLPECNGAPDPLGCPAVTPIFSNGFETGNTSQWTLTQP